MASVQLVRRWGSHDAGQSVEVDDTMAAWLIGTNHAEDPNRPGTASAGVLAPGRHGADLRAGGDLSRPGRPQWSRGPRVEGVSDDNPEGNHVNRAGKVHGTPKAAGDVSHVAAENLGREHTEAPAAAGEQGDAPKSAPKAAPAASGGSVGDSSKHSA